MSSTRKVIETTNGPVVAIRLPLPGQCIRFIGEGDRNIGFAGRTSADHDFTLNDAGGNDLIAIAGTVEEAAEVLAGHAVWVDERRSA